MPSIIIKYDRDIVLEITEEDQNDLKHDLKGVGDSDVVDNIEGWIKHSIKHFITRRIEISQKTLEKDTVDIVEEDETSMPTVRSEYRAKVRLNTRYRNRDQRDEDERAAKQARLEEIAEAEALRLAEEAEAERLAAIAEAETTP
jgi:uncharacterized membrane protein YqiK